MAPKKKCDFFNGGRGIDLSDYYNSEDSEQIKFAENEDPNDRSLSPTISESSITYIGTTISDVPTLIKAESLHCGNVESPHLVKHESPHFENIESPLFGNAETLHFGNAKSVYHENAESFHLVKSESPNIGNAKSLYFGNAESSHHVNAESPHLVKPESPHFRSSDSSPFVNAESPSLINADSKYLTVSENKTCYIEENSSVTISYTGTPRALCDEPSLSLTPINGTTYLYDDYQTPAYSVVTTIPQISYSAHSSVLQEQNMNAFTNSYSPIYTTITSSSVIGEQSPSTTPLSDSFSRSSDEEDSVRRGRKRLQRCRLCANHHKQVQVKGHKWYCPHRNCECSSCHITKQKQFYMKEQQKLTRRQQVNPHPPSHLPSKGRDSPSPLSITSNSSNCLKNRKILEFPRLAELERDTKNLLDGDLFEKVNQICRPKHCT